MEKLIQRQNITLEYQGFSADSPKTPYKNSDEMDFNDVFGGPPRRFSMQDMRVRCSFSPERIESDQEERTPTLSSPWSTEKPVFGEEISNSSVVRRRQHHHHHHHHHQSDDFYADIFRGDESSYNSPRRSDLDRDNVFGSSPSGSRIMSPSRHSPSRNEPFSTSFPAQFSLPAKLTKAAEIPTFGSRNHNRNTENGLYSPQASSTLSRFSNQVNRNSGLSHQNSMSSEDFSPPHTDHHLGSETDGRNVDDNSSANHFHFSIYKWAGREVPVLIPLSNGKSQKDKSKFDSFAESKLSSEANYQDEVVESFEVELEKKVFRSEEKINETQVLFEESNTEVAGTKHGSGSKDDSVVNGEIDKKVQEEVRSFNETEVKESVVVKQQASSKSRGKSLRTFMTDKVNQPGKGAEMKENKVDKTSKGAKSTDLNGKNTQKKAETDLKSEKVEKSVLQGDRKSGVKGKIRDFVQIFNQEADSSLKSDVSTRSKSYRWKPVSTQRKEEYEVTIKTPRTEVSMSKAEESKMTIKTSKTEVSMPKEDENEAAIKTPKTEVSAPKAEEKLSSKITEKKQNVALKVEEKVEAKQYNDTKTPSISSNLSSNHHKNVFSSDSKPSVEILDDPLEFNFLVQELSDDQLKNSITQNNECSEDIKALDAKIHQWSLGKKGNIRSLLSTLQYVLWQGSGWQPVPLVDLIEANSVKRAYQKALLRLHPDKLQQKGAANHHKYIAEKVFDILQEAWDHFNTLGL